MRLFAGVSLAALVAADKKEDLVTGLPGFPASWPFKAYSGLLDVPGPIAGYDALKIHYQFHTSQRDPATDPVVTWHQGGPGGSSISIGLYGELGAFSIGQEGNYLNPWAFNKFANMLYLESPAGSGSSPAGCPIKSAGYSQCIKGGKVVGCKWNDQSQAEAYAHTLQAFYKAFPEFAKHALYLTGESYFGQYGPNIAHFILNNEPFKTSLPLKGIALGNACWGGNKTLVACNGPSEDKIDVDLYFGKGLYSPRLKAKIDKTCKFPTKYITGDDDPAGVPGRSSLSQACRALLKEMDRQVGPHNVYDIYDNCPQTQQMLERIGRTASWLRSYLRRNMANLGKAHAELTKLNGGYKWDCFGDPDKYLVRADVRKALHLDRVQPSASSFDYDSAGPASITLYPELVKKLHVLIYNGDADSCVPYNGNEEWIMGLEDQGVLKEAEPWTPWYTSNNATAAGYITRYEVPGAATKFHFMTIRLAGHMVPQFMPEAASVMLGKFLAGQAEREVVV